MITLGSFLGALLAETARGRAISDRASVQIADQYLRNEFLKGFPVPRMQVRDLEVELRFAVSSKLAAVSFLEDQEAQRHISYRLREFLSTLPGHRDFKDYFGKDTALATKWKRGLDDMARRLQEVLARPAADSSVVIQSLSLCIRNYFHESAPEHLRGEVSSLLARRRRKEPAEDDSLERLIERQIREIVMSMDRSADQNEPAADSPLNFNVLVGAAELEKVSPALLSSIKISVSPADRRWIVSEHDGKKVYTLGT